MRTTTKPTRREFLKRSTVAGAAIGLPSLLLGGRLSKGASPNADVRLGIIGLGGLKIPGSVGGRGRQLISGFRKVPGVRIVALCDVDQAILDHEVEQFKSREEQVATHHDLRKLLDDKDIDAVAVALPNHWHALATVWACQAGKDVYVEKPFSYDIWEGRQMVAAARKYGRMVQTGTQRRSSESLREAFEYLRSGQIGPIRCAHAIVYRAREGIGKVSEPTPVPATLDYDLWVRAGAEGPGEMRPQLHYEWHWFWATGNGEIGNNGVHAIDVCRWGLGENRYAPRAMSIGGRFAVDDCGETANTQIAFWDFQPAPLICEIRNLRLSKSPDSLGKYRGQSGNTLIDCEGGYFAGDSSGGTVFDRQGAKVKEFAEARKGQEDTSHLANFVAAVHSRRADDLRCEALQGHLSAACCHMANVSYRLGKQAAPEAILETVRGNRELADAFERCQEHLRANGVDLAATPAVVGPWVTFDGEKQCFVGELADQANRFSRRECRAPFVVPEV